MIPQIQPWIDEEEMTQLKRVVDSTYVTEHELTKEFEELFRYYTGAKYCVSATNGTAALYMILRAMGIGVGDQVIVPDITFIATANAVIMTGAIPVFAPVDKYIGMDPDKLYTYINKTTKAIIPVHLYGQSCQIEKIISIARKNNIKVIEDAAQAVGVIHKGRHAGTFGDAGILSFYGNKTLTCGEGGLILTNDKELRDKCYRLKNHGRDTKGTFFHEHIGFNFCFTEMQAAIGIAQFHKLDRIIQRKQEIYDRYMNELSETLFKPLPENPDTTTKVRWFTSFYAPDKETKESFISFMQDRKIQTRQCFYPLHAQPCYKHHYWNRQRDFLDSIRIYDRMISLPSSYNLTNEQQDEVINAVKHYDRIS